MILMVTVLLGKHLKRLVVVQVCTKWATSSGDQQISLPSTRFPNLFAGDVTQLDTLSARNVPYLSIGSLLLATHQESSVENFREHTSGH